MLNRRGGAFQQLHALRAAAIAGLDARQYDFRTTQRAGMAPGHTEGNKHEYHRT
jgi:hypothetical protein